MKKWWLLVLSIGLLILQLIYYRSLRHFPEFVEEWYSTGIYPYIGRAMRFGLGWIPFSFGDLVYGIVIILALRWVILFILELFKKRKEFKLAVKLKELVMAVNLVLFFFHMAWGFNYYRQPLNEILELDSTYTDEQLISTNRKLIFTANKLHQTLQTNDSLAVVFHRTQDELFELAPEAFENLKSIDPALTYGPSSIKESLLTLPLTYMGYSGYLNPITGEAQTNGYINNYKTPVLILHEMSHQLGFAKENEANFIAVISGMKHEDPYFQYSACIFALRYCLNDLYLKDPAAFQLLKTEIYPGIFQNYKELDDFWEPYDDNVIEKVSQASYNTYLQANNQPDGMRTYSYVVALLVNYYQ